MDLHYGGGRSNSYDSVGQNMAVESFGGTAKNSVCSGDHRRREERTWKRGRGVRGEYLKYTERRELRHEISKFSQMLYP